MSPVWSAAAERPALARVARRLRRRPHPTERRRTFLDHDRQVAFERDGYVVVDLLEHDRVRALRAAYDQLDHQHQAVSPWVEGFETSLYDDRRTYRSTVLADVEHVVGGPLDTVLDRHRIMFANYVVKLPHSAEVPPHADWTFLDEGRYSSATVWCPLVDTSIELRNGPLGVAVGSHERIDFLRVANIPSYDRCVEAVSDLPRSFPDLRAGQAIVMDNRVVHFSPPNETEQTRVAVGCVVGPAEAPLHHYWVDDDGQLLRFVLDREFYLSYEIGRPQDTEGIVAVEVVPADEATGAVG